MKEEVKDLWIDALRSGMYDQGSGCLLSIDKHNNKRYCCWGVLCHISDQSKWDGVYYNHSTTYPPKNVLDWAEVYSEHMLSYLASMNDRGTSFKEIADYIENNWKNL